MSEWAGPKGKQPARPHPPSRLRQEIRLESTDDERNTDKSRVEVPNSDIVIPETQLEVLGHSMSGNFGPDDGVPNHPDQMSPKSRALLERTQVSKAHSASASFSPIKFLSKPALGGDRPSPPPFMFSQARKAPTKTSPKEDAGRAEAFPASAEAAPASDPPMEEAANGKCLNPGPPAGRTAGPPSSLDGALDGPKLGSPVGQRDEDSARDREESLPLPEPENQLPSEASHTLATDSAAFGDHELPEASAAPSPRPFPRPNGPFGPWRPPSKKGKRPRRMKGPRHSGISPAGPMHAGREGASAEVLNYEQPILDVSPNTPDDSALPVTPQEGQHNDGDEDLPVGPAASPATSQSEHVEASNDAFNIQEDNAGGYRGRQYASPPAPHPDRQIAYPPTVNEAPKAVQRHPDFEEALHGTSSRGGSNRVDKPRRKPRPNGPAYPLLPRPGIGANVMNLAPENDAFLGLMGMALRASELKARDIVDSKAQAYETAIAALQETVTHQNNVIEDLRTSNGGLNNDRERLKEQGMTMQKFMNGMDNDYRRLKKDTETHHKNCKQELEKKIKEIESEKTTLLQEFSTMIGSFDKGQKSMKATLDECFIRLQLSDFKKKNLAEQLSKQNALLEEEKKRRTNLEQQILPSLQNFQRHLEDSHAALSEKLGSIQTSEGDTAADKERDACLKECIDSLRSLQATPLLTAKDFQKAESMLRFVHESIDTKLVGLMDSVEASRFPVEGVQTYIHNQLQNLSAEVLKYDEVAAEYHKAQRSNEILNQRLETQKEQCGKLEEQIGSCRQDEADLRSRYSQLENELSDLRQLARDRDSNPDLEQEMTSLRHRVRKAEDDLQTKITELDQANQHLQGQASEVAKSKQTAEEHKKKLIQFARDVKKSRKANETAVETQAKIEEKYQKAMKEKEVSLNDEIHRLRRERDGKDAALVALQKDLEETREKLQAADFDVQSYREETKRLERENVDAEKKLKKAQQVVDEESSFSSELADLKEQLAQNTDALHCKERDLTTLRKDYSGLKSKVAHREDEKSQLQMQLTESHSAIERLRKESDARVEKHQKDTAALLEARNHVESLQKEKRGLESSLERSRLSESKMNDAQAKFLVEREGYQTEIAELQAAIEAKEREMGRVQAEAAEKLERAAESHRLEVRELRHRLRESENALKETETNLRRSEIEHNRQVEEVKKGFRKKFDQLVQAKVTRSQEQSGQSILPGKPRNPQPFPTVSSTSVDTLHNVQEDNPRKKVSRQNNSVLGSSSASHTLQGPVPDSATALNAWSNHREEGPLSLDLIDPALRDDLGARGSLDEHGVSVVGPAPAVVPETQESLTHSFDLFNLDTNQASGKDKSSNSILSDIPSEELDTFETEHWPIPAPVGAVRRERPLREELPVHGRNMETPIRASNVLYPDSQYSGSQDRPKSQANTASRIMPPPQQFPSPGHGTSGRVTNSTESRPRLSQRSGRTSANATSSPDYVHQPALGSMTYSLRSGRNAMPAVLQRDGTPKIPEQPSSYKRKSSANYDNESPSSKRYRSSSQSLLPSVPKVYQAQAAGVSDAPSRLRGHRRTPDPAEGSQGPMSYPRRSSVGGPARKSPARSSQGARGRSRRGKGSGNYEDRFAQELENGRARGGR